MMKRYKTTIVFIVSVLMLIILVTGTIAEGSIQEDIIISDNVEYIPIFREGGRIEQSEVNLNNEWVISNDNKFACRIINYSVVEYALVEVTMQYGVVLEDGTVLFCVTTSISIDLRRSDDDDIKLAFAYSNNFTDFVIDEKKSQYTADVAIRMNYFKKQDYTTVALSIPASELESYYNMANSTYHYEFEPEATATIKPAQTPVVENDNSDTVEYESEYCTIWDNGGTITQTEYNIDNNWVISDDVKFACRVSSFQSEEYGEVKLTIDVAGIENNKMLESYERIAEFHKENFERPMKNKWGVQLSKNIDSCYCDNDNNYVLICKYRYTDGNSVSPTGDLTMRFKPDLDLDNSKELEKNDLANIKNIGKADSANVTQPPTQGKNISSKSSYVHQCQATGCDREGIYSIKGITGNIEYYCRKHYDEIQSLVNNMIESASGSFTNEYGSPTTKCAHAGCNNYIASSGDTSYCVKHSRNCLVCGKYIDEDAMYCLDCILKAFDENNVN